MNRNGKPFICANQGAFVTRGFEAFSRGTMGNGGRNLYVSRAGVLQRIFQFDTNRNGYLDLVFCNSQNHWERPPTYIYPSPLTDPEHRVCVPAEGARSGVVADLTGDGYDDLVVGNYYGGVTQQQNSSIYFGSPEGTSERYRQELPAPLCESATAGDFNGDGKMDVALQVKTDWAADHGTVRIFYQTAIGFEPKRFVDVDIEVQQLDAADIDGDGFADLVVRRADGEVRVYWGGPDGIDAESFAVVPVESDRSDRSDPSDDGQKDAEYVADATPLVRVMILNEIPYVYVARERAAYLVPLEPGARRFAAPLVFDCAVNMAVAIGDVDGNGVDDLVFACRLEENDRQYSVVYWGGDGGYSESRRTLLPSHRACDVVLGDLDGDGCDEIVLCQNGLPESFTSTSSIYRGVRRDEPVPEPIPIVSEDARRVLLLRQTEQPLPKLVLINHFARGALGDLDVYLYQGGPDGYHPDRKLSLPGWGAVDAVCCDINDDGWADLVICNCSENSYHLDPGSFVYLGGPNGFPDKPSYAVPSVKAHGMLCADFNKNGYLDFVFGGVYQEELLIFYGTADGFDTGNPCKVRLEYDGGVYGDTRWLFCADLNNNGWLDIVVPHIEHDRSFVLWGGPDGYSMARAQALSVNLGTSARGADFNGNGYLDLVIGGFMPSANVPHDTFVCIYWNGPDGLREDRRTLLPARGTNAMAIADFNNDGMLDLFVCSYHDVSLRDIDSYIYWNREGRGFSAEDRTRLFTHSASACVAADFNDDGWVDLAIAYHKIEGDHVGWSAVWWNGPNGFDEKRITKLPTMGPHGMTCIEPGNILDRGPEEYYISEAFELPPGSVPTAIAWEADTPPRTWVDAQLRTAETKDALVDAPWTGPDGPDSRFEAGQPIPADPSPGRWLQYRLALGADKGLRTPRVEAVTVKYREEEFVT